MQSPKHHFLQILYTGCTFFMIFSLNPEKQTLTLCASSFRRKRNVKGRIPISHEMGNADCGNGSGSRPLHAERSPRSIKTSLEIIHNPGETNGKALSQR